MGRDLVAAVTDLIDQAQKPFAAALVDPTLTNWHAEAKFATQIVLGNDYLRDIALGAPQSLINAITNIAAIGISLNPATKQAYLVPRDKRVVLDISYMGLVDLATKSGSIVFAQAHIVHEADEFKLRGVTEEPVHVRDPFGKARGEILGAYVVAKLPTGEFLTHTMAIDVIHAIRERSEAFKRKKGPWVTDYLEMVKKTVVKQASKSWPETPRLKQAIHLLDTESGEGIVLDGDVREIPFDIEALEAELRETNSDAAALAFWNQHRGQMKDFPALYERFKQSAAAHRVRLREQLAEGEVAASAAAAEAGVTNERRAA